MVVLTMTNCPPKLRGDLSKWLCEINTGVYVGNVSSRVRFHHRIWSAAGPGRCTGGGADHAGLRGRKRSGRDHSPDRTQRCGIAAGNRTTGSAE
ncbi:type I-E CRISPR-associated endoribonuclease Cas2 [Faecalibacterium sp. BIOML-A2]|nr:type I-E CRISPR-associated endoribonuclease Cas2 [Faecalibacterium sp. BIOML-A2]MSD59362.1 type I-E CRISPR-associated endoribonuclease Cas2 [Faecalibacterium sp. BIOML-A1]